ncbi:MAG TPA: cyclic 2,3-diphosphoglycerate synthase [Solirubrobacteraceae bacterium]|nr:cyclic 2,3-diphosphoglycerate synthase [Solirubrobacteraceae bacterium]
MRRLLIMGAGGRDFHNFNVVYRADPDVEVVAFTAAQIPGIADRVYPASLAGPRYPDGIPVLAEDQLEELVGRLAIDEVVFAYSDVSHEHVMHIASRVLAAGADFRLLGPAATMLASDRPVVAVCAVRTGAGKSQTSRRVGQVLRAAGLRPALIRHPMPYHDLEAIRVQRFETTADIDRSAPTIEEREEYERVVAAGLVMYAGVDYAEILHAAETEADVIVWDGGNNDFPFIRPDVLIVVVDPLRPGHGLAYHPGETNLRMADVVLVNKVDSASTEQVRSVMADITAVNPGAVIIRAASPVSLDDGPSLAGRAVLVVEDGPTITHGGMPYGAGTVAAQHGGTRVQVDPRRWAVGSIAQIFDRFPHIGPVLPAMGYSATQLTELQATINAVDCDVVVAGTPVDLARLIQCRHPIRQVHYELQEIGEPTIEQALAPVIARAQTG